MSWWRKTQCFQSKVGVPEWRKNALFWHFVMNSEVFFVYWQGLQREFLARTGRARSVGHVLCSRTLPVYTSIVSTYVWAIRLMMTSCGLESGVLSWITNNVCPKTMPTVFFRSRMSFWLAICQIVVLMQPSYSGRVWWVWIAPAAIGSQKSSWWLVTDTYAMYPPIRYNAAVIMMRIIGGTPLW